MFNPDAFYSWQFRTRESVAEREPPFHFGFNQNGFLWKQNGFPVFVFQLDEAESDWTLVSGWTEARSIPILPPLHLRILPLSPQKQRVFSSRVLGFSQTFVLIVGFKRGCMMYLFINGGTEQPPFLRASTFTNGSHLQSVSYYHRRKDKTHPKTHFPHDCFFFCVFWLGWYYIVCVNGDQAYMKKLPKYPAFLTNYS